LSQPAKVSQHAFVATVPYNGPAGGDPSFTLAGPRKVKNSNCLNSLVVAGWVGNSRKSAWTRRNTNVTSRR